MASRVRASFALVAVPASLLFLMAIACSSPSGQGNGCQSTGANQTINAQDNFTYDRPSVTITVGERVCWQNQGTVAHTVTAEFNATDSTWNLDGQLNPDLVVLKSFGKTGDFLYHCTFHRAQGMTGVIHVR